MGSRGVVGASRGVVGSKDWLPCTASQSNSGRAARYPGCESGSDSIALTIDSVAE